MYQLAVNSHQSSVNSISCRDAKAQKGNKGNTFFSEQSTTRTSYLVYSYLFTYNLLLVKR